MNPFKYSSDNKRYHTFSYYSKKKYGKKIVKIPLNAGFTCPNRDGTKGTGGCLFCPSNGADSFPDETKNLLLQYENRIKILKKKWNSFIPSPYFQSYTNTYGTIEKLESIYEPFLNIDSPFITIGTRSDCINEDTLNFLKEINKKKKIHIELGIQSIFDETTEKMHCYHPFKEAESLILKLKKEGFRVSCHLINGLPNETPEMMIESAKKLGELQVDGLKFHSLLILKNSYLENVFIHNPEKIKILSREEYVDILIKQLEVSPPEVVIERAMSDAPKEELIAPLWPQKKFVTLNLIDNEMKERNTYQGKFYKK